ncbi:MAG TPA: hypothetical protein VFI02_03705 [Armatimonadota bacterium]|nr:hypothetical protein [Armatimonadota bacterium]
MPRPEAWESVESVPSRQEMALVKRFQETGYDLSTLRDCALQAGYPPANITPAIQKALKKIANNPKLQQALKKQGVTMSRVAKKLDELLEAKHPQYPEQNDNLAQGKALELAVKIMDAMPSQKIELDKTETHVIQIAPETIAAIQRAKGIPVIDIEPESVKGYFE